MVWIRFERQVGTVDDRPQDVLDRGQSRVDGREKVDSIIDRGRGVFRQRIDLCVRVAGEN